MASRRRRELPRVAALAHGRREGSRLDAAPHSLRLPDGGWRECECAGRTRGLRTLAALRLEHQPPASAGVSARLRRIADPR